MKILLVNDDGYGAPGLMALCEALRGRHEVVIVAPDGQRSGAGQSVTLSASIRAVKREHGYAISGTPADCVKIGLRHLMPDCDLVISGINPGANLGVDCYYSGTASAAREAAMGGKPALASSCYCREFKDVECLARFTAQVAERLMAHPLPGGVFLNLNMPNTQRGQAMPLQVAPMSWFRYDEEFERCDLDGGQIEFRPRYGKTVLVRDEERACDLTRVRAGIATLTPVAWDCTCRPAAGIAQDIADEMKDAGIALA